MSVQRLALDTDHATGLYRLALTLDGRAPLHVIQRADEDFGQFLTRAFDAARKPAA